MAFTSVPSLAQRFNGSPGEVVAKVIYAGHFPRPFWKCFPPYESKVIRNRLYRIRIIYIRREKVFPIRQYSGYMAVINDQVRNKFITNKYPAAFWAF